MKSFMTNETAYPCRTYPKIISKDSCLLRNSLINNLFIFFFFNPSITYSSKKDVILQCDIISKIRIPKLVASASR